MILFIVVKIAISLKLFTSFHRYIYINLKTFQSISSGLNPICTRCGNIRDIGNIEALNLNDSDVFLGLYVYGCISRFENAHTFKLFIISQEPVASPTGQ